MTFTYNGYEFEARQSEAQNILWLAGKPDDSEAMPRSFNFKEVAEHFLINRNMPEYKATAGRAYHNDNGQVYTILKGELGKPALLVKHSHPDGYDFIITRHLGESSWSDADYVAGLELAVELYNKIARRGGSW